MPQKIHAGRSAGRSLQMYQKLLQNRETFIAFCRYLWYYDIRNLPSLDKGKHACQRVFSALFALFALLGVSPAASQKPKITRKSIAGRCGAALPEQKCVQARKDPQRILAVLSRGLTQYGRISARQNRVCSCQSMVTMLHKLFRFCSITAILFTRSLLPDGSSAERT